VCVQLPSPQGLHFRTTNRDVEAKNEVLDGWSLAGTYGGFGLSPQLGWEHACDLPKGCDTPTGGYLVLILRCYRQLRAKT
jgi:hypothetical protein